MWGGGVVGLLAGTFLYPFADVELNDCKHHKRPVVRLIVFFFVCNNVLSQLLLCASGFTHWVSTTNCPGFLHKSSVPARSVTPFAIVRNKLVLR